MNVQVYSSTGSCPYKLVFSQRPRAVLFPRGFTGCVLEEDLVKDGVAVSDTSGLKCAASDSFVSSLTQAPLLGSVQPLSQYLYFITMMVQLQKWDPTALNNPSLLMIMSLVILLKTCSSHYLHLTLMMTQPQKWDPSALKSPSFLMIRSLVILLNMCLAHPLHFNMCPIHLLPPLKCHPLHLRSMQMP